MIEIERGSDLYMRLDVRDVDCTVVDLSDPQICAGCVCELWTRGHADETVPVEVLKDNVAYLPWQMVDWLQPGQIVLRLKLELYRDIDGKTVRVVKTCGTSLMLQGEPGRSFDGADIPAVSNDNTGSGADKVVASTDVVLRVSLAQTRLELSYCDIKDIEYQDSEEDGGVNILTIVTEDGRRRSFPIRNGKPGTTDFLKLEHRPDIDAMTAATAKAQATADNNTQLIGDLDKKVSDGEDAVAKLTERVKSDEDLISANAADIADLKKADGALGELIRGEGESRINADNELSKEIEKRLETSVFDTYKTEQAEKDNTQDANIKALADYLTEEKQAEINEAISKSHTQNTDSKLVKGVQSVEVTEQSIKLGHYAKDEENLAMALGNGTSDASHNAMSVDWNGNMKVGGSITDGEGNILSKKVTLSDLAVNGRVTFLDNNGELITLTIEELRNLLMWVGTEAELDALPDSEIVEGRIYSTFDGTIKRRG